MKKLFLPVLFMLLFVSITSFLNQACKSSVKKTAKSDTTAYAPDSPEVKLLQQAQALFVKLPDKMPGSENDTPEMVELGKRLYMDNALSVNDQQSCNTCHPVDNNRAGADHEKTGLGTEGKHGERNDPMVFNAGYQIAQFWDGRAATLEDQAKGPILNPIEMGMPNEEAVIAKLKKIDGYPEAFNKAFPNDADALTYDNLAKAIAAFERTLITKARIDKYLDGDIDALTVAERRGLKGFIDAGCIQCHVSANFGGSMYQKMGVFHPYKNTADIGRAKETKDDAEKYFFKVPMLRNTLMTGPYFHDGGVDNMGEAIDQMAYLQLDKKLTNDEIKDIMRFFVSLSDEKITGANFMEDAKAGDWKHPSLNLVDSSGAEIAYGYQLLTQTNVHPDVKAYVGNDLTCVSCHQEGGTKKYSLPWVGVSQSYPQYRGRENREVTLAERINGCFERSLNGKALPLDGKEMKAMVIYMDWVSKDAVKDQEGMLTPEYTSPDRKADLTAGELAYKQYCMSCHGLNGTGYKTMAAADGTPNLVPALWGPRSFNNGAGTGRVLTLAGFVKASMPLGIAWNNPTLSDENAFDVAAYINSKDRPKKAGLEKDYPDLTKKPADCPYPPYADKFPQEQHKYGPFKPIKDAGGK